MTTAELPSAEQGTNRDRGNLLGVQPSMTPRDYTSEQSLYAKLDQYLAIAGRRGWLNKRTVVVFPEYIGTWLAAAGEPALVSRLRTLTAAMAVVALRHPTTVLGHALRAPEQNRLAAAIFRTKARQMAQIYQSLFARLAACYTVTIVGGSLLLPSPRIENGTLLATNGSIQNISAVFAPDGALHPQLVRKLHPTAMERPIISAAPLADLPVFDTPAGRLGVLICADSWYPEPYARLRTQGVDLLAVPSYVAGTGVWTAPWGGYAGTCVPADVDTTLVGRISEAEAWRTYALDSRLAASGARCGINVFLRGDLWDLGGDGGDSLAICHDESTLLQSDSAGLLCLWL